MIGGAIAGNPYETSIVAEYKDGSWSSIGNLARVRRYHRAIKSGSDIMILGGTERGPST